MLATIYYYYYYYYYHSYLLYHAASCPYFVMPSVHDIRYCLLLRSKNITITIMTSMIARDSIVFDRGSGFW